MHNDDKNTKVYSPDLQTFELSGPTGMFGTLASVLVGPVRLILRTMHNVMILPADLLVGYADSVIVTGVMLALVGVVDLFMYRKWPLIASQLPVILIGLYLKTKAVTAVQIVEEKPEVDIDLKQVDDLCNTIIAEVATVTGKEE